MSRQSRASPREGAGNAIRPRKARSREGGLEFRKVRPGDRSRGSEPGTGQRSEGFQGATLVDTGREKADRDPPLTDPFFGSEVDRQQSRRVRPESLHDLPRPAPGHHSVFVNPLPEL